MTIETRPLIEKNALQKVLLEIAAKIDVPRNLWEQAWYDLAEKVGYTTEEIEKEAVKNRPKLIQTP